MLTEIVSSSPFSTSLIDRSSQAVGPTYTSRTVVVTWRSYRPIKRGKWLLWLQQGCRRTRWWQGYTRVIAHSGFRGVRPSGLESGVHRLLQLLLLMMRMLIAVMEGWRSGRLKWKELNQHSDRTTTEDSGDKTNHEMFILQRIRMKKQDHLLKG